MEFHNENILMQYLQNINYDAYYLLQKKQAETIGFLTQVQPTAPSRKKALKHL